MRLGLGLGIVKSAASIYKGILDKFPNAVAAYSTRKLKTSYPTTLPADYGGGAAAAYSLRKVKSDYGGSAVKVRRSSDGGLQDIGFDSNGNLDTTALTTFVGGENKVVQSENLNTTWSKSSATPTASTEETPDGDTTSKFIKLVDDNAGGTGVVFQSQNITLKAATQYAMSAYFKADGVGWVRLQANDYDGSNDARAFFNLSTGAVGTELNLDQSATMTDVGNGWYRCTIVFTMGASDTSIGYVIGLADADNDFVVDLDGTSSIFAWGMMVNQGNSANTYISTTTGIAGDGAVTTFYDQAGSNNATNSSDSEQPLIVEAGDVVLENGKPAIKFDGVDDVLQKDFDPDIAQPLTLFHVRRYRSNGLFGAIGYDTTSGTGYADINVANDFRSYYGSYLGTTTQNTNQGLWYSLANGTSSEVGLDGATAETGNAGTAGLELLSIGSVVGYFDAPINTQEIIIFNSDQSTNRKDIEWNINNHYSIYDQWDRESCMNVRRSSDNATQDIGFSGKNINQTQLESFVNDASPVLDDYTGAAAAYSLRKVRSAYTGNAINVRRSSDGTSQDIGFDANGDLDTTALQSFVNEDVDIYTSDFSSTEDLNESNGTGAAAQSVGGVSDAYKFTLSGGAVSHFPRVLGALNTTDTFNISFDFYIPSSNLACDGVQLYLLSGSPLYNTLDAWTSVSLSNVTSTSDQLRFYATDGGSLTVNGDGDVFYLKNIVITQTTADGHVTTWYDQAGINNATADCSNPSACEQPLIVEAGDVVLENNKPAIKFDGVDDSFTANALAGLSRLDIFFTHQTSDSQYVHFAEVSSITDRGFTANNGDSGDGLPANMGTPTMYNNGTQFTGTTRDDVRTAQDGHQIISYIDADTTAFATFEIGGHGSYIFNGKFQELIAFDSDQSTNRLSIEGNIGRYYNLTGYRNGFVTKWYDQSGEYNHAENSTSDEQPQIVSNGSMLKENGKAAIDFDGVDDDLSLSFEILTDTHYVSMVAANTTKGRILGDTTFGYFLESGATNNRFHINFNLYNLGTRIFQTQELVTWSRVTTSSEFFQDGTSINSATVVADDYKFKVIASSSNSVHSDGLIQELIIFNSDQSSNREDIEKNINTHFKIYS